MSADHSGGANAPRPSETEDSLRRVTQLAARLLEMPFALASAITDAGVPLTVAHGLEAVTGWPFAQVTAATVLGDLRSSARFAQHPAVTGAPGIRFYAAAPLRSQDGFSLGTLCVMDTRLRPDFSTSQQVLLAEMAAIAAAQFELGMALARTDMLEKRAAQRLVAARFETRAGLERAVSGAKLGLVTFDGSGRVTLALGRMLSDAGLDANTSLGKSLDDLQAPFGLTQAVQRALEGQTAQLELRSLMREGARFEVRVSPMNNQIGDADGAVAVIGALEENEASDEVLLDPITALPGRALVMDRLEQLLVQSGRNARPLTLVLIELEGLDDVARTLGEAAFVTVMQEAAHRLRSGLRGSDTVARWGFGAFAALLPGLREADTTARIVNKLLNTVESPMKFERHTLVVGARAGVSLYPTDGENAQTLLANAEAELRRARDSGERIGLHEPVQVRDTELQSSLEGALERGEFFLEFQPQFDLRTNAVVSLEALLRWRHPSLGVLSPDAFLGIAEAQGLIAPIGAWVLGEALRQASGWPTKAAQTGPRVAVNVSALQFRRTDFAATVMRALEHAGFAPERLELELSEGALMRQSQTANRHTTVLGALGVRLAIDDFGHDAFSLGYLQRLPVDTLKIDRTFVRELEFSSSAPPLLGVIVGMAREMRRDVVAKGVETQAQAQLLRELGCARAQGFFFSEPLSAESVPDFLREHSSPSGARE